MALKKTQLLDITSVTGINTVGIFTVGVTPTAGGVGVASTSYIKNVIMHNTGLGTARVSLFINPNTANANALGYGVTANRFLRLDVAPNETAFFESTYPIVMTDRDSLSVEIAAPDAGGSGIGSCSQLYCQRRHRCLIMGVRSLGNVLASYGYKFGTTGIEAVTPALW